MSETNSNNFKTYCDEYKDTAILRKNLRGQTIDKNENADYVLREAIKYKCCGFQRNGQGEWLLLGGQNVDYSDVYNEVERKNGKCKKHITLYLIKKNYIDYERFKSQNNTI